MKITYSNSVRQSEVLHSGVNISLKSSWILQKIGITHEISSIDKHVGTEKVEKSRGLGHTRKGYWGI